MDSIKNWGIVLRQPHNGNNKISVLDKEIGKIDGIVPATHLHRLCRGAIIQYVISTQRNGSLFQALDIIEIPFEWARHDILFLHHLLEITFHFLPFHIKHDSVFELLRFIYSMPRGHSLLLKKLYVMRLFILLGMYPDINKDSTLVIALKRPFDDIVDKGIHLGINESELDAWLLECVFTHPHVSLFKTMHFLTRSNKEDLQNSEA